MEVCGEGSHLSLAFLFHHPAPSPQHRILLDFLFLDTECTYDYLFVYDGDSPRGPLLASLSGSTRPPPIEASSGKVGGAGPWAVAGGSQCSVGKVGRCTHGGTERRRRKGQQAERQRDRKGGERQRKEVGTSRGQEWTLSPAPLCLQMLLHLFSDANYNLLGFNASFRFSLCPGGCRNHGQCRSPGVCACEPGWGGPDCGLQECSAYCGSHGTCASVSLSPRALTCEHTCCSPFLI